MPHRAWRSDDATDLVAVLALEPTHRLRRDDVADKLWPDVPASETGKRLDHCVRDACKALHDRRAVTTEGAYLRLWPLGTLSVDVLTFLATAKHVRNLAQREAARLLYTGDLLPDALDNAWTEPLRTRARLVHLELLRGPDDKGPSFIDLRDSTAVHR